MRGQRSWAWQWRCRCQGEVVWRTLTVSCRVWSRPPILLWGKQGEECREVHEVAQERSVWFASVKLHIQDLPEQVWEDCGVHWPQSILWSPQQPILCRHRTQSLQPQVKYREALRQRIHSSGNRFAVLAEPGQADNRPRRRLVLVSQQAHHGVDLGGASDAEDDGEVVEPTVVETPVPMDQSAGSGQSFHNPWRNKPQWSVWEPCQCDAECASRSRRSFPHGSSSGLPGDSRGDGGQQWRKNCARLEAPVGLAQDDALPPTSERSCVSQEVGDPSHTVPGRRLDLFVARERQAEVAHSSVVRRRRRCGPDEESGRASRALSLVFMGELSAARQALEGASVALGNLATLGMLTDPTRTPSAQEGSESGGAGCAAGGVFHSWPNGIPGLLAKGAPGWCRGPIRDDIWSLFPCVGARGWFSEVGWGGISVRCGKGDGRDCRRTPFGPLDSSEQTWWRCEGNHRGGHLQKNRHTNNREADCEDSGRSHSSLPVHPLDEGRMWVHRSQSRGHRHFHWRGGGVQSDLPQRHVGRPLEDGGWRSDPPLCAHVRQQPIDLFVGRRVGGHATHRTGGGGGRGARRSPHAHVLRVGPTSSFCCCPSKIVRGQGLDVHTIIQEELWNHANIHLMARPKCGTVEVLNPRASQSWREWHNKWGLTLLCGEEIAIATWSTRVKSVWRANWPAWVRQRILGSRTLRPLSSSSSCADRQGLRWPPWQSRMGMSLCDLGDTFCTRWSPDDRHIGFVCRRFGTLERVEGQESRPFRQLGRHFEHGEAEGPHRGRDHDSAFGASAESWWRRLVYRCPLGQLSLTHPQLHQEPEPNQPKHGWQTRCVARIDWSEGRWWGPSMDLWLQLLWPRCQRPEYWGSTRAVPAPLVPQTAPAPPPVSPHLPMWPPVWPVWPPSRSVPRGGGLGEERVSSGACRGASLQRGRRSSLHEHVRPRHGPCSLQRIWWTQVGDRGGWSFIVARGPAGHWHDHGLPSEKRRNGHHNGAVLDVAPLLLQGRAEAAWVWRWSAILTCTAARALSVSLLDCRPAGGSEGAIPSVHEVMRDSRFQWALYLLLTFCLIDFSLLSRGKKKKKKRMAALHRHWPVVLVADFEGPRPPSVRWPTAQKSHDGGGARAPPQTRHDSPTRRSPDEVVSAAQERVQKLKRTCSRSVGGGIPDPSSRCSRTLWRRAKLRHKTFQLGSGWSSLRNSSNDRRSGSESSTERAKEARLLEEAKQRAARLRTELVAESPHYDPPTNPADYAQELVQLRVCVEEFQRERGEFRAELSTQGERRSRGRSRSLPNPSPDLFAGELQRGSVNKGTHRLSSVMQTLIDNAESFVRSNRRFNVMWIGGAGSCRPGMVWEPIESVKHPIRAQGHRSDTRWPTQGESTECVECPTGQRIENVEVLRGTQDASGTRRRRRLRALPWFWDSDSESDGRELRRQARRSQRSFPITHVAVFSEEKVLVRFGRGKHVVPRTYGELPATVPASQTAVNEAGMWVSPEQVPLHVFGCIGGWFGSSREWSSALPIQNRFVVLDQTVKDSSDVRSMTEEFPMTNEQDLDVCTRSAQTSRMEKISLWQLRLSSSFDTNRMDSTPDNPFRFRARNPNHSQQSSTQSTWQHSQDRNDDSHTRSRIRRSSHTCSSRSRSIHGSLVLSKARLRNHNNCVSKWRTRPTPRLVTLRVQPTRPFHTPRRVSAGVPWFCEFPERVLHFFVIKMYWFSAVGSVTICCADECVSSRWSPKHVHPHVVERSTPVPLTKSASVIVLISLGISWSGTLQLSTGALLWHLCKLLGTHFAAHVGHESRCFFGCMLRFWSVLSNVQCCANQLVCIVVFLVLWSCPHGSRKLFFTPCFRPRCHRNVPLRLVELLRFIEIRTISQRVFWVVRSGELSAFQEASVAQDRLPCHPRTPSASIIARQHRHGTPFLLNFQITWVASRVPQRLFNNLQIFFFWHIVRWWSCIHCELNKERLTHMRPSNREEAS